MNTDQTVPACSATCVKRYACLLIAVIAAGAILRLINIGAFSLWYDETLSMFYSGDPARLMPGGERGNDSPLYLGCLALWRLVDDSDGWLRGLSLMFGVATVPVVYLLGRELAGRTVGLAASAMQAFAALHVYYAQELRTYTLTTLLAIAAILFFVRAIKGGRTFDLAWFALFSVLASASHYYGGLIFVAAWVYLLIFRRRHAGLVRRWLVISAIVLVAVTPLVVDFARQMKFAAAGHWTRPLQLRDVTMLVNHFAFGYQINNGLLLERGALYGLARKVCFAAGFGMFALGLGCALTTRKTGDERVRTGWLLTTFALIPIGVILAASIFIRSAFLTRYLLFCSPIFYVACAIALVSLRRPLVIAAVAVFLLALNGVSLYGVYTNAPLHDLEGVYQRRDNGLMADYIKKNVRKGDVVAHTLESTLMPVRYYCGDDIDNLWLIFPGRDKSGLPFAGEENERPLHMPGDAHRLAGYDRIWYVKGWWVNEGDPFCEATSKEALEWLRSGYVEDGTVDERFNGGRIYLFARKR